jgi:hypothetical protein
MRRWPAVLDRLHRQRGLDVAVGDAEAAVSGSLSERVGQSVGCLIVIAFFAAPLICAWNAWAASADEGLPARVAITIAVGGAVWVIESVALRTFISAGKVIWPEIFKDQS